MRKVVDSSSSFLYLADSIRNEDSRQDAYLILLERQPQTKAEAELILSSLHHRTEWNRRQDRKRNVQLTFNPPATQVEWDDGVAVAALDRLPDADRHLIEEHVLEGLTLRQMATKAGVSKDTIAKR